MEKSRLKSHLKQQAYKNVLWVLLGLTALIIFLVIFGTNILIGFSLLLGKLTGSDDAAPTTTEETYVAPPTLDIPFDATSSATIRVTGQGTPKQRISLYNNGKLVDKTSVRNDNSFSFSSITLEKGENRMKAKAVVDDKQQSAFSNEIKVVFSNEPPELSIDSPTDGQGVKKENSPIKVTGKTDAGATVTVNDFRAIVDADGEYTYLYPLKDGDNDLKVTATDEAGNKTTKEIKIHTE